jgi:predicted lipoprotein with Yx(FWY)xxD motif
MSVRWIVAGSLAAGALMLAACSSSGSGSSSQPPAGNPPATTGATTSATTGASGGSAVTISGLSTSKGTVLSDGRRILYSFDPDSATMSNCTGACATTWPPVTGTPTAGTGVAASGLTTITRADGTKQVAFDGHPLYEYAADTSATDVSGDGVAGKWHVVKASGAAAPASSNPAPATSGGGYNY